MAPVNSASLHDFFAKLDAALRAEGLVYGQDVWLRVHKLVLQLGFLDTPPEDLHQIMPLLRPLFCRNPEEQQRFTFLFEQCLIEEPRNLASVNRIDSPQQQAINESLAKAVRIKRTWLWGGIVLLIAVIAALALLWPEPHKVEKNRQHQQPRKNR